MISDINKKILETKERLAEKKRLEKIISKAKVKLREEETIVEELLKRLQKEERDVKRLESLTLTALFFETLGTKDQKLQKEQQEFVVAKLKYDNCKSSITLIKRDIEHFEYKIEKLGDPKSEYDQIMKTKEDFIKEGKNEEYNALVDKIVKLKSRAKELTEAITAAKKVQIELRKVIKSLKSAGNWGTLDLLGGGLVSTAVKHSKIDDAKRSVHQVQYLIDRFYRELSDVNKFPDSDLNIQIGAFDTFADFFFDGLIFDWIVQSKINRSLTNSETTEKEVSRIVSILEKEATKIDNELVKINEAKIELLEKA
ncbi:hypothetical protein EH223_12565 [candidate division KSB1 bacterium]|nr:hypothetical protein [candidate division KSB1 bacterium]RQW02415.1 MAG: hypothetical protein EH223_12565 [candidate division KSB1 bacterium]